MIVRLMMEVFEKVQAQGQLTQGRLQFLVGLCLVVRYPAAAKGVNSMLNHLDAIRGPDKRADCAVSLRLLRFFSTLPRRRFPWPRVPLL